MDICVAHHQEDSHFGNRLAAILRRLGIEAAAHQLTDDGGLPIIEAADAMVVCLSPKVNWTVGFAQDCQEDSIFPPTLFFETGNTPIMYPETGFDHIHKVLLVPDEFKDWSEDWLTLMHQLASFFERPALGGMIDWNQELSQSHIDEWMELYPNDPIISDIEAKGWRAPIAMRWFRWRMNWLLSPPSFYTPEIVPIGARVTAFALPSLAGLIWLSLSGPLPPPQPTQTVVAQFDPKPDTFAEDNVRWVSPQATPASASAEPVSLRTTVTEQSAAPDTSRYANEPSEKPLLPGEFRESFAAGGEGPVMVSVPAGSFMMGSAPNETAHDKNEAPRHRVNITSPLAISKYEVTETQFQSFLKATGQTRQRQCEAYSDGEWRRSRNIPQIEAIHPKARPAVCLSWAEANAYADWLSNQSGHAYRLLSEAEWEYAARAGSQTMFSFGDDPDRGCAHMNAADLSAASAYIDIIPANCQDGFVHMAPVGSLKANAFGLHDMHGNVWEWTADGWTGSHSEATGTARPRSGARERVVKGGSWFSYPYWLRSANRNPLSPDTRRFDVGFRVARDLEAG